MSAQGFGPYPNPRLKICLYASIKPNHLLQSAVLARLQPLLLILLLMGPMAAQAQPTPPVVQVSGIAVAKGGVPIPYVGVKAKGTMRNVIGKSDGYFSIAIMPNDTLQFFALGFRTLKWTLPANFTADHYSFYPELSPDTFMLPESNVFALPSPDEFRVVFENLALKKDKLSWEENLDQKRLQQMARDYGIDGPEMQDYALKQLSYAYVFAGGQTNYFPNAIGGATLPTTFFSPQAWVQFVRAIQRGEFKKRELPPIRD